MGIYILNIKVEVICSTKWNRLAQRWRRGRVSSFCLSSCCKQTSTHMKWSPAPPLQHHMHRKLPWQYLAKFGLIIQEAQLASMQEEQLQLEEREGRSFLKEAWCPNSVYQAFCCFCLKWGNWLRACLLLSTLGEMPAQSREHALGASWVQQPLAWLLL